jgi:hypothetical protein
MACLESGTITRGDAIQEARTLTFDEFIELPNEIGAAWADAVEVENPFVNGVPTDKDDRPIVTEDAEKKF